LVTVFYEPSTRTRTSFEIAGKYLSADTVNLAVSTSSVQKGESLRDTIKTIEVMGFDVIVMRHAMSGTPHYVARNTDMRVINAGDGANEHPTQALLDLYTIKEKKGTLEGLAVTIVGDILHSRVARSNIYGLSKFGCDIRVVGPSTLMAPEIEKLGVNAITTWRKPLPEQMWSTSSAYKRRDNTPGYSPRWMNTPIYT
jgi:aspartate carbamoyltransferase catalytic subunit